MPPQGLRCQLRAATGAGKSLTAVHIAERLRSERTLVLVPSLPLLEQTVAVWRREGHGGRMVGLCSLTGYEQPVGLRCTTDPAELVKLTAGLKRVTVFATYASVGLGHLEKAHQLGLPAFSSPWWTRRTGCRGRPGGRGRRCWTTPGSWPTAACS
ncbi:DEAD/DEAH box helicase family protein [Kitasatospora saccharophila]|uniref:DEAD/DEAH box helicase family protein n=1 Tax=Kitasatospora saccharophila TaxID=407973 RepID=UPI00362D4002